MADVSKELSKLSKVWSKTEAKQGGGGGNRPEDGEKELELVSMKVAKSKKGRLQVASLFKIRKPKNEKGKEYMTFRGLENENNIAYFKGFAEVIGLELPDDMEDLPEAIESFVDEFEDRLTVKLKTKGEYQNMTVLAVGDNKVADNDDSGSDDSGSDDDDDSDSNSGDDDDDDDDKKKKKKKDDDDDDNQDDPDDDDKEEKKKKKKKKKKNRD